MCWIKLLIIPTLQWLHRKSLGMDNSNIIPHFIKWLLIHAGDKVIPMLVKGAPDIYDEQYEW